MSEYGDRPRRRGHKIREPEYIETEDVYARGPGSHDLVIRDRERRDEYDDYPDYRRQSYREDYGPPERRARSHGYRDRDAYYEEDYYSDRGRPRRGRDSRYDDDYDDDYRPRDKRSKSKVGGILEDLGLGGVAAAVTKQVRGISRHRRSSDDYDGRSRGYSRSRSRDTNKKWQQAAKAAVLTGVIEAVRSRKEPGGWTGAKGQRIATAALGAAGIDGFLDRDADSHSKRHIVESVVGGLGINRVANGPRDKSATRGRSQSRGGRSRSRSIVDRLRSRSRSVFGRDRSRSRSDSRGRSQSRGPGIKELVGAGAVAAAGKAIYNRVRSKSRGRLGRSRSRSVGSDDSYVPSRRPRYGERDRGGPSDDMDRGRQAEQQTGGDTRGRSSSTSSVSTTDLENQRKKTRGKELLTAGLATVATIHAAHGVYSSMQASEARHKLVATGEMSPQEARKRKSKNMLQDAAAVGIAALGIKGAFSEWKEMNESRHEKHEVERRHRRHKKAQERRAREMQYAPYPGGYPPQRTIGGAPQYGDSNPYASYSPANLPPPPVGGPSQ